MDGGSPCVHGHKKLQAEMSPEGAAILLIKWASSADRSEACLACSRAIDWSCCTSQAECDAKRAALDVPCASCHMSRPLAIMPVALSCALLLTGLLACWQKLHHNFLIPLTRHKAGHKDGMQAR